MRKLHVYADELDDIGPYDERSPIYALSLIFVDEATDRSKGLSSLKKEEKRFGLGRFFPFLFKTAFARFFINCNLKFT